MTTFRDAKRLARLQLHQHLSEDALYLVTSVSQPQGVSVRLHLIFNDQGNLLRTGFADVHDFTPQIVFLGGQVVPVRGAIVVTRDLGAWRVDNTLAPDDITIKAEAVKLTPAQVLALGWDASKEFMGLVADAPSTNPGYLPGPTLVQTTPTPPEAYIAAVALGGHRAVWLGDDAKLRYADHDELPSALGFIGITTASYGAGELVPVQTHGLVIEPSWNFDPTKPVFIGQNGGLTQIPPTSGYIRIVGDPASSNSLLVAPQPPIFIS